MNSCTVQSGNQDCQNCNETQPNPERFEQYKRCVWNFKNAQERYLSFFVNFSELTLVTYF